MKTLSITNGLKKLDALKQESRKQVFEEYEPKAKDCMTCEVQGICCTDARFVNEHITRLEAEAMIGTLARLTPGVPKRVFERNAQEIKNHCLSEDGDTFEKTYSCPLFEKGIGCQVHEHAKPLSCIQHACYENESDLPEAELLSENEDSVARLNQRVFRNGWNWLPIPLWLEKLKGP